jgi:hypothetical protein
MGVSLVASTAFVLGPAAAHADTTTPQLQITAGQATDSGDNYAQAFGSGTTGGTDSTGTEFHVGAMNFTCPDGVRDVELYLNPEIQTSLTAVGTQYEPYASGLYLPLIEPYVTQLNYDPTTFGYSPLMTSKAARGGLTVEAILGDSGYWTESTAPPTMWGTDMATVGGLASVMSPGNKYTLGMACMNVARYMQQDPADSSRYASVQSYLSVNTDGSWDLNASPTAPIGTTTTLTADSATSNAGDPVTLTATGPTGLAGSVDFYSGTTKIDTATVTPGTDTSPGTAVLTTTALPAGNDSLTATFNPDNSAADQYHQFGASTSTPLTHQVNAINTTTTVTAPATRYGSAGHVTVKVTAPGTTPTGKVTLTGVGAARTATLSSTGTAVFALPRTLRPRSYTVTASYTGNDASSVGHATLRVAKATPGTPVVKVTKKPTRKKTGKATITVATRAGLAKATGRLTLTLKLGKKTKHVTGTLRSGRVTIKLPKLTKGKWKLAARYAGNTYYTARTSRTLTIRVR